VAHQSLHSCGSAGVGKLVTRDVDEDFSESGEDVEGKLPREIDVRDTGLAAGCVVATRARGVDLPLDDSTDHHVGGPEKETGHELESGSGCVAHLVQQRVDTEDEDGGRDDDGERVGVAVGSATSQDTHWLRHTSRFRKEYRSEPWRST
jgi:hypothetical protein